MMYGVRSQRQKFFYKAEKKLDETFETMAVVLLAVEKINWQNNHTICFSFFSKELR